MVIGEVIQPWGTLRVLIGIYISLQLEECIEKTVKWYLDNQEWLDHVTSGEYLKYYNQQYKF